MLVTIQRTVQFYKIFKLIEVQHEHIPTFEQQKAQSKPNRPLQDVTGNNSDTWKK